jgi:hypothetical protein
VINAQLEDARNRLALLKDIEEAAARHDEAAS